jgi:hypothetical protein
MGWYFTILQEMREMGLKGNDLIVFAVINGFSQNGNGSYHGSLASLQEMCGISSRQTITDILKSLQEKGFISKSEIMLRDERHIAYAVSKKWTGDVQKMDRGCPKNGHNIYRDNNIGNYIECNKGKPKFCKPTIPEIESYCRERGNTIDAEEFFNFYESKGWVIGKSPMKDWKACIRTWERNKRQSPSAPQAAPRKRSVLDNNREVAEQLMRMSMMTEDTI